MNEVLPSYFLKRNTRSSHIRVSVSAGGLVRVTAPKRVSVSFINDFLFSKKDWLLSKVEYFKKIPDQKFSLAAEKKCFIKNKEKAKTLAEAKVFHLNRHYGFAFGKISIRNSHSRWGSCSSKGTLCFNYKIIFLPEDLANYLVVHEICHLKEPNHSKAFWALVRQTVSDYAVRRSELHKFGRTFKLPVDTV